MNSLEENVQNLWKESFFTFFYFQNFAKNSKFHQKWMALKGLKYNVDKFLFYDSRKIF